MTDTIPTTASGDLPTIDADPFGHDLLEDPLPFHEALREAGPVVHLPKYDVYAMGRYADVHAALVNWQDFPSGAGVGLTDFRKEEPWRPPSLLLETDPPKHDAPRQVLAKVLNPRALRRFREQWNASAEQHVDRVLEMGEIDAVTDLSQPYPVSVFPDAVGLTKEGREHLVPYGTFAFNAFGPHNDIVEQGLKTLPPVVEWINAQCPRDRLTPDGLGADIYAASDRRDITAEQAPLMVRSLLTAGVDTTINGISAILYAFARHPEMWQRLREDPSLARVGFDEAVRWESPVQTFFRVAERDVDVSGSVVPKDCKILMFLGSANRDPRRWDNPDQFDLARDPSGHVGFGMGIHQCVGQHVARLEAELLLRTMAAKVARIELIGDPVRKHNNTLRSWQSLPMRLVPA